MTSISVHGVEQKYFFEVVNIFENLSRERIKIETSLNEYLKKAKSSFVEIEENRVQISEQLQQIDDKTDQINEINEEISQLSGVRDEIEKKIAIGASVEKEHNERVNAI